MPLDQRLTIIGMIIFGLMGIFLLMFIFVLFKSGDHLFDFGTNDSPPPPYQIEGD